MAANWMEADLESAKRRVDNLGVAELRELVNYIRVKIKTKHQRKIDAVSKQSGISVGDVVSFPSYVRSTGEFSGAPEQGVVKNVYLKTITVKTTYSEHNVPIKLCTLWVNPIKSRR